MTESAQPVASILLHFDPEHDDPEAPADLLVGQLSTVTRVDDHLWLASDESNTLDRLSALRPGTYGRHRPFRIAELLDLPGEPDDEIDVEGLDHDGGYLWLVGSHGLKRRKADASKKPARQIERLADVRSDGNRCLLARVPVAEGQFGMGACREHEGRTAARLMGGRDGNLLTDALRTDPHLASFLVIPSKDNGFDVEGIAVQGDRVFLGLRGPVLRGWAVVLELRLAEVAPGLLTLVPLEGRALYRKHFLELRGLGVRELYIDGDDLLLLAGPTMDVDGPAGIFRWRDALSAEEESLVGRDELPLVVSLPYGTGQHGECDHPEGMVMWEEDAGRARTMLVVYDSPHRRRIEGEEAVRADVFRLTG